MWGKNWAKGKKEEREIKAKDTCDWRVAGDERIWQALFTEEGNLGLAVHS